MAYRILLRRDTLINWNYNEPVLLSGEAGFVTDTGRLKIGDGQSNWSALPYLNVGLSEVNQNILPASDRTYDIGSDSLRWRNGYFGTVYTDAGTIYIGTAQVSQAPNGGIQTSSYTIEDPNGATGIQLVYYNGTLGVIGANGITGGVGGSGSVGPQGPAGPQGVTGAQGSTGSTGATGPQGSVGATGPQGSVGATGPQGPSGATNVVTTTGVGGASSILGTTINIPIYQTQIPHLEWNDTDKTIWNNGKGDIISNTSFGSGALESNISSTNSTAIGVNALNLLTTGAQNTAVGSGALSKNISSANNVGIGKDALRDTTAGNNTAVGTNSLLRNTTGISNTAVGNSALNDNIDGDRNTAVGQNCLSALVSGDFNVAIGDGALSIITTGSNNVAIGKDAILSATGSNNVAIGYNTNSGGFDGSVILGASAVATGNNQFVVGNAGAIATETITANCTWTVRINGVNYKIPLLQI